MTTARLQPRSCCALLSSTTSSLSALVATCLLVTSGAARAGHDADLLVCPPTISGECLRDYFGSTALYSEELPALGPRTRILADMLAGDPLVVLVSYDFAGTSMPVVSLSRDSDAPVQFFEPGDLAGFAALSPQEGFVISEYRDPNAPGIPPDKLPDDAARQRFADLIVSVDPDILATLAGPAALQTTPIGADPYGMSPTARNFYRDNFGPTSPNPAYEGALWLGSREVEVPFYASCTYADFNAFIRACDQDYTLGNSDPSTLNDRVTAHQESLLGCGPFQGSNCDEQGIDLSASEPTALLQSFPGLYGQSVPQGQDPATSGGQWRTDGLEPGAPVMALNASQAGASHFPFVGQLNMQGVFEPIPAPGPFLTDAQLLAAGRPARYEQPGTLPFVVANAGINAEGERVDAICSTSDMGGGDSEILPGCHTKWKDHVGGQLNLFGADLECREASLDGFIEDPRCVAGTPENRAIIQAMTHLSQEERDALLNRPRGGTYFGGEESLRADWRSWSVSVDGDPDRLGFDGAGTYTSVTDRTRNEIVFRTGEVIFSSPGSIVPFDPSAARGAGHPFTGQPFASELAGLSWNFLVMLVSQSAEYKEHLFDPESPASHPAGLGTQGNPLAFSTWNPTDPANAPMAAAIADLQIEIDALDPIDDAAEIAALEAEQRAQAAQTQPICSFITPQTCSLVAALVPEPARLWLEASAILVLLGVRRRLSGGCVP